MGHSPTYYVAENPWYLVAILGLVAAGFLLALKVTQEGRYLVRALAVLGLAGALIVVDLVWVTEAERVEAVIRDLGVAVARSDGRAALALMDQHVTFGIRSNTLGDELVLSSLADLLGQVEFDVVRISRLTATAGTHTGRGQAEFRVTASGSILQGGTRRNFLGNSEWSIGLRRVAAGAWKINRITAVELPQYTMLPTLKVERTTPAGEQATQPVTPPPPPPPPRRGLGRFRGEP